MQLHLFHIYERAALANPNKGLEMKALGKVAVWLRLVWETILAALRAHDGLLLILK